MNTKDKKQTLAQFAEQVSAVRETLTDGPRNVVTLQFGEQASEASKSVAKFVEALSETLPQGSPGHCHADAWALAHRIDRNRNFQSEGIPEAAYLDAIAELARAELARAKAKREYNKAPHAYSSPEAPEEITRRIVRFNAHDSLAGEARSSLRRAAEDLIEVKPDYDL